MDFQEIIWEVNDHIGRITLNRPQKRNPLGPTTVGELCQVLRLAREDPQVRVVILSGAGDTFSAGGDLGALKGAGGGAAATAGGFADLNLLFTTLGKPTIAMVQGAAMGGGLGLVVACDLALAAESALFATPETKVGLWPMIISAPLQRCVGRRQALRLMLGGERLAAAEALRIGLVTEVLPDEELVERTNTLAARLATRSPAVTRLGLQAFNAVQDMELEPALRLLEQQLWAVLGTEDAMEGIRAFMEKRAPEFKGR